MLALGVELLMRRAVITRWDNREEPEWPPHPDRVFMALVAAWGESGEDPGERVALEWVERLGPPVLRVSLEATARASFTSYVPVNDTAEPMHKGKFLPPWGVPLSAARGSHGSFLPSFLPTRHFISFRPEAELPAEHRDALARLCGIVTYLGHSSTPVRIWIETQPVTPNLFPTDATAPFRMRVFGSGRTAVLKNRFDAGLRPVPSLWSGYAPRTNAAPEAVADGPFDPGLLVFRQVSGRKFSLESCGMIADAIRTTLMSRHGPKPPEWLTGHGAGDQPSRSPRPAYLPLGFVGRKHADGHLLGVAIAVPTDFPTNLIEVLFDLLARHGEPEEVVAPGLPFLRLQVGNPDLDSQPVDDLTLELDERPFRQRPTTLHPDTWTGPADLWATVTPVMLPQFPRRRLSPEEVVLRSCSDAGYPEPASVRTSFAPVLPGVPHSRSFHARRSPGRPPRPLTHAVVLFAQQVRGPVLLGAGRYTGFGVCRPVREEELT